MSQGGDGVSTPTSTPVSVISADKTVPKNMAEDKIDVTVSPDIQTDPLEHVTTETIRWDKIAQLTGGDSPRSQ